MSQVMPFHAEGQVALSDDLTLSMVINFRTIDRLEGLLGFGMDQALSKLGSSVSMAAKFLWAMTRDDHDDLSIDQIAEILVRHERRHAVMALLGRLVKEAFNLGDGSEGEQSSRPPTPSNGASSASIASGARQVSRRANSGGKRRARS